MAVFQVLTILWSHPGFSICKGCDRLHPGDGLHPVAPQWYWEDCLSSVLQMERSWPWTIQACSGGCLLHDKVMCIYKMCTIVVMVAHNDFISLYLYSKAKFEFHHGDYEKQFLHAAGRKDKAGMVMNNPNQSVFLFLDRQHLQVGPPKQWKCKTRNVCTKCSLFFLHIFYRLQKLRPLFSSCAVSASTYHRISWPVGGWEISKTTFVHTCQTRRDIEDSSQGHWSKLPSFTSFSWIELNLCLELSFFVDHSFSFWHYFSFFLLFLIIPPTSQFWFGPPIYSTLNLSAFISTCTNIVFEWLFSWSSTVNNSNRRNSLYWGNKILKKKQTYVRGSLNMGLLFWTGFDIGDMNG